MAEERTLKAAAVKIGQTPSAISQNIKALENFLGVTLFERDSRPILLTKAGRRLFALARELLQKNDEILEAVRSEKKKYETLRLGLGESAAGSFGPQLIAELNKIITSVDVVSGLTLPLVSALMSEKIDVLLSPYPIKDEEELEREVLFQEDFVLVVKKGHEPIISEEAFQTLIISRPLIEYNQDSSDRIQADRLLRSLGQKPALHTSVSTSYLVVGLVSQLDGWSLIPPFNLWAAGLSSSEVDFYPIPGRSLTRTYWMVRKQIRNHALSQLVGEITKKVLTERFWSKWNASSRDFLDLFMFPANNKKGFGNYNLAKAGEDLEIFMKGFFSYCFCFSPFHRAMTSAIFSGLTKSAGSKSISASSLVMIPISRTASATAKLCSCAYFATLTPSG